MDDKRLEEIEVKWASGKMEDCVKFRKQTCAVKHEMAHMDFCSYGTAKKSGK